MIEQKILLEREMIEYMNEENMSHARNVVKVKYNIQLRLVGLDLK